MIDADQAQDLARDGFVVIPQAIPTYLRTELEQAIRQCYAIQARKITAIRHNNPGPASLDQLLKLFEQHDHEAGYQALALLARSEGGRRWSAWDGWGKIAERFLGCHPSFGIVGPPVPFINLPKFERLLYHWHCEQNYYPKRRNFVKCWTPLFRPKHAGNGTMVMARGSHLLGELPFVEYTGYSPASVGKANHLTQYEIPESFFADCERVKIHAEPGDLVVFHPRCIHSSSANMDRQPSYAAATLVFDVRADLTLSGTLDAKPYGGDYGRPGMDLIQ